MLQIRNFLYYLEPWNIMNAKMKMRQYAIVIKPRKSDTSDIMQ